MTYTYHLKDVNNHTVTDVLAMALMFTSMEYAMSIFVNNIPVSIKFFCTIYTQFIEKPPGEVSVQLDFENRLIQRNWTFTFWAWF